MRMNHPGRLYTESNSVATAWNSKLLKWYLDHRLLELVGISDITKYSPFLVYTGTCWIRSHP